MAAGHTAASAGVVVVHTNPEPTITTANPTVHFSFTGDRVAQPRTRAVRPDAATEGDYMAGPIDPAATDQMRCWSNCARTVAITSSGVPCPVNPAARRCPPPPRATATRLTSTAPLLRSDTAHSSSPVCFTTTETSL